MEGALTNTSLLGGETAGIIERSDLRSFFEQHILHELRDTHNLDPQSSNNHLGDSMVRSLTESQSFSRMTSSLMESSPSSERQNTNLSLAGAIANVDRNNGQIEDRGAANDGAAAVGAIPKSPAVKKQRMCLFVLPTGNRLNILSFTLAMGKKNELLEKIQDEMQTKVALIPCHGTWDKVTQYYKNHSMSGLSSLDLGGCPMKRYSHELATFLYDNFIDGKIDVLPAAAIQKEQKFSTIFEEPLLSLVAPCDILAPGLQSIFAVILELVDDGADGKTNNNNNDFTAGNKTKALDVIVVDSTFKANIRRHLLPSSEEDEE